MALSREEVRRIAALARLDLTPAEEQLFSRQLARIVGYFDCLADFEPAAPGASERAAELPEAVDEPAPCLPRETFLANAPESFEGFLVVPRVKVSRTQPP